MRSLRWLTVVGIATVGCGLSATVADACVINGFGANGGGSPATPGSSPGPGGAVRPGDAVDYSIRVVSTDDSPGDSRYVVDVNGVTVASGTAMPVENGGEWVYTGSFPMPNLGPQQGTAVVALTLADSGGRQNAPALRYDGRPAAAPSPEPASQPSSSPAAGGTQSPAATGAPGRRATPAAKAVTPKVKRTQRTLRTGAARPRVRRTAPPARAPHRIRPERPTALVQTSLAARHARPAVVAAAPGSVRVAVRPERSGARRPRAAHAGGVHRASPVAPTAVGRTIDPPQRAAVAAHGGADRGPRSARLLAVLALLMLGGGLAGALQVRRRRRPVGPVAPRPTLEATADGGGRDIAIEAELQQIIAVAQVTDAAEDDQLVTVG